MPGDGSKADGGSGSGSDQDAPGAASGASGASGSQNSTFAPKPAATRTELIARADRHCRRAQARVGDGADDLKRVVRALLKKRITKGEYYARSAELTVKSQRIVTDVLAKMQALGRPRGRRAALDRYLAATRDHAAVTGRIAAALRRGKPAEVGKLNRRWLELSRAAHSAAKAYGFKVCGGT
jgi:hypothetical protein